MVRRDDRRTEAIARVRGTRRARERVEGRRCGVGADTGTKTSNEEQDANAPERIAAWLLHRREDRSCRNPEIGASREVEAVRHDADDRAAASTENRTGLGGDIMIHGSNVSIGCLAIGNQAAEDLFVLAALVGKQRVRVVIAPVDFRLPATHAPETDRPWITALYAKLDQELQKFPRPVR